MLVKAECDWHRNCFTPFALVEKKGVPWPKEALNAAPSQEPTHGNISAGVRTEVRGPGFPICSKEDVEWGEVEHVGRLAAETETRWRHFGLDVF